MDIKPKAGSRIHSIVAKTSENRGLEEIKDGKTLRLFGGIGSPYSNKMLMYLRFRRLPHRWILMHSPEELGTEHCRGPVLLPKLMWPDGTVKNDSTFLIESLEKEHEGRSAYPHHKGLQFLNHLMEDFADEWFTKCMYHHRWTMDPVSAGKQCVMEQLGLVCAKDKDMIEYAKMIERRQTGRRGVVGSNDTTGKAIEEFYKGFLRKLETHLKTGHPYLFGSRPSSADFSLLGQLHPMIALDQNTSHMTRETSVRVCSWYNLAFDLSGLSVVDEQKGWLDTEKDIPPSLKSMFVEIGRWYAPYIIANDQAYRKKQKTFTCALNGGKVQWSQLTFKYQVKCLRWLTQEYVKLGSADKAYVQRQLEGTGCMEIIHYGLEQRKQAKL